MVLLFVTQTIVAMVCPLLAVAYFSLLERKVMGLVQIRLGPEKIGSWGTLQPIGDALKLAMKQMPRTSHSNSSSLVLVPVVFCGATLLLWIFSWETRLSSVALEAVLILLIYSVLALGPILTGWVARSPFALIGSTRAIAQTISFEVIMSSSLVGLMLFSPSTGGGCHNAEWLIFCNPLISVLLFLSLVAESGRGPFDLPEGESELVGGYIVDFGGSLYKLIFLAENISCIFIGSLTSSVCMGGFSWIKSTLVILVLIWIRSTWVRVRFDELMKSCWEIMLPGCLALLVMTLVAL